MTSYEMLEFDEQYFKDNYLQPHEDFYSRSWQEFGYLHTYDDFKKKLLDRSFPLETKGRAYYTDSPKNVLNNLLKAHSEGLLDKDKPFELCNSGGQYQSLFLYKSKTIESHDRKAFSEALRSLYQDFMEESNKNTIERIKSDMDALKASEKAEKERLVKEEEAKKELLVAAEKLLN